MNGRIDDSREARRGNLGGDGRRLVRAEEGRPLERVAQLTDVSRPRLRLQPGEGLRIDLRLAVEEVIHVQRDVLGAFSQRRQHDDGAGQSEEQVLAKRSDVHGAAQIAVGCRDDPDVDVNGGGAADRHDDSPLERAEQA